jgi:spore germination protein GerM
MKTLVALVGLLVAGVVGFTLVGCGSENAVSLGKPGSGAATTTAPEQTGTQKSNVSLEVWFSRDNGLVAVRRSHPPTQLVATAAMNALLDGPTAEERSAGLTSAVPPGTRLLGIAIHDGLATVDLTSE